MVDINSVVVPDIIEEIPYSTLKTEVQLYLKELFVDDVEFLESDSVMLVVEALLYREMLLRSRINQALRGSFLSSATGNSLEAVAAMYGIERDDGQSDAELRVCCVNSLYGYSTAGSRGAYEYFSKSADSRILKVSASSPTPGDVLVVYHSLDDDVSIKTNIELALNKEEVRPLSDTVEVRKATIKVVNITPTLEYEEGADIAAIKISLKSKLDAIVFEIGEIVYISKIISECFINGVKRVSLSIASDIVSDADEIIKLNINI